MFLRNAWYVAAWASEVAERALFHRFILGEPVLLYRKLSGEAIALGDRCPHRFAPLHLGRLVGDVVECGYHGLQFNAAGACILNPHGEGIVPPRARIPQYVLVEKYGLLWIWMGTRDLADPETIPDFQHLVDPARATVGGVTTINAHYELATDNLMDLTHVRFVHKSFVDTAANSGGKQSVEQVGNTIVSTLWYPNGRPSALFSKGLDTDIAVDHWFDIRWDAAALMRLDAGMTPTGRPRAEGRQTTGSHLLTPESKDTTHYFFANSRNYGVNDPEMDTHFRKWQKIGFGEQDKPMIEATQRYMGTTDLMSLKPTLLRSDAAAVKVRRILCSLLEAEQQSESNHSAGAQVSEKGDLRGGPV
jgi:phenylpropionate dioxygenase-like ring-hydroxylating dioxygenase large terminal subunit